MLGAQLRCWIKLSTPAPRRAFSPFFSCIVLSFVLDHSCQAKLTYWCHEHIGKPVSMLGAQLRCWIKLSTPAPRRAFSPFFSCIVLSFVLDHSCQAKLTYWCHEHIGKPVSMLGAQLRCWIKLSTPAPRRAFSSLFLYSSIFCTWP